MPTTSAIPSLDAIYASILGWAIEAVTLVLRIPHSTPVGVLYSWAVLAVQLSINKVLSSAILRRDCWTI
jgi:hypothetical protein